MTEGLGATGVPPTPCPAMSPRSMPGTPGLGIPVGASPTSGTLSVIGGFVPGVAASSAGSIPCTNFGEESQSPAAQVASLTQIQRSAAVPVGSFLCPKCKKVLPLSESILKGAQLWCIADNRSYNGLVARWSKSPKLRAWWNGLKVDEQVEWFLKWQSMDSKSRFENLTYGEEHQDRRGCSN